LHLAGSQVVVAESYARIFFRNCMSTGELYPVETDLRICEELKTGEGGGQVAPHMTYMVLLGRVFAS
jgi:3-isopropylmalate dehydratase small subunit